MTSQHYGLLVRVTLALLLISSGVDKMRDLKKAAQAIERYDIIPVRVTLLTARLLTGFEILIGLSLLLGPVRIAGWATFALFVTFACAIGINVARGRRIDCGCGGLLGNGDVTPFLLVRDLIFAAIGLWLGLKGCSWLSMDMLWSRPTATPKNLEAIPIFFFSVAISLAIALVTDVRQVFRDVERNER